MLVQRQWMAAGARGFLDPVAKRAAKECKPIFEHVPSLPRTMEGRSAQATERNKLNVKLSPVQVLYIV